MTDLTDQTNQTATALSSDQAQERLSQLGPGWQLDEVEGRQMLWTDLEVSDFATVVQLLNAVAQIAQEADHHPDLYLHDYNHLTISLTTHEAGGVTQNDFSLAARINTLFEPASEESSA